MKLLYYLLVSLRPRQWLKNTVVFAAIFLGGELFDLDHLQAVWTTFIVFCLASSSMYLINDVVDRHKDRLHPTKKERPLASGSEITKAPAYTRMTKPSAISMASMIMECLNSRL